MQSLKEPKDVLEECIRLVNGNSHLGISEKATENDIKIVDPVTGKELYLSGYSENTEIKNDEIETPEGSKPEKKEDNGGIRDTPRSSGENDEEEGLKTLIMSFVTNPFYIVQPFKTFKKG